MVLNPTTPFRKAWVGGQTIQKLIVSTINPMVTAQEIVKIRCVMQVIKLIPVKNGVHFMSQHRITRVNVEIVHGIATIILVKAAIRMMTNAIVVVIKIITRDPIGVTIPIQEPFLMFQKRHDMVKCTILIGIKIIIMTKETVISIVSLIQKGLNCVDGVDPRPVLDQTA